MVTFKQISRDGWKSGDFRTFACINKTTDEIFGDANFEFEKYYIDGLGKAKTALFITSNGNQFGITEYLEPTVPITEIWVLNSPKVKDDFRETLEVLNLNISNLDWVDKSVIE